MQRRKFIHITALGGTAIGLAGISCNHARSPFYNVLDKPGQLSYIWDAKTINEIGKAYRQQVPGENEAGKLVALLSVDSAGKPFSETVDSRVVEKMIDGQIISDFEHGDTVVVKGWILAKTEARQCALYDLNHQ